MNTMTETATAPVTEPFSSPGFFRTFAAAFGVWLEQRRAVAHLNSLNDRLLKDIGIDRTEITAAVYGATQGRRS